MDRAARKQGKSSVGLSVGLKSAIGIVAFALLILVMVLGAGLFEGRSKSAKVPFDEQPPNERASYALERGRWAVAAKALQEMLDEDPFDARSMYFLAYSFQSQKKFDEAREWYKHAGEFHLYRLACHYNLACINALEGKTAAALEELKIAIEGGFTTRRGIGRDKDFASIKDDPEFRRLMKFEDNRKRKR